ncbi:MAG: T9SS type A sorting domain-containing protein, partial [Chlorobi bacterium]|nr:T9SS type A sorting domain-containing protein [Chlorobiota bacterium]
AKQQANTGTNGGKWILFGDPSMRFVIPENTIVTEAVNGIATTELMDTLNPGEHIIASGFLTDKDGNTIYDFSGLMKVKVYERARIDSTLGNDQYSYVEGFLVQDSVMAEFEVEIINGQFVFDFQLPYELAPEFGTIKLSYYAIDGLRDARGHFSDLVVGGQQSAIYENKLAEDFISFYPTIVSRQLNYLSKQNVGNLKIEIFDLSSKMVFSTSRESILKGEQNQIDVSNLQKGMYLLRAYYDDKVSNVKFVKQ